MYPNNIEIAIVGWRPSEESLWRLQSLAGEAEMISV